MSERAAELAQEFDASFSRARGSADANVEELLAIGVARSSYAIRLHDVAALAADKVMTPVPSRSPLLLGLAGFRGNIVSVYDLRLLLGEADDGRPRWVVLARAEPSIGLGFDRFERHLRVPPGSIASETDGDGLAVELVRTPDGSRPIINLVAALSMIRSTAAQQTRSALRPSPRSMTRSPYR